MSNDNRGGIAEGAGQTNGPIRSDAAESAGENLDQAAGAGGVSAIDQGAASAIHGHGSTVAINQNGRGGEEQGKVGADIAAVGFHGERDGGALKVKGKLNLGFALAAAQNDYGSFAGAYILHFSAQDAQECPGGGGAGGPIGGADDFPFAHLVRRSFGVDAVAEDGGIKRLAERVKFDVEDGSVGKIARHFLPGGGLAHGCQVSRSPKNAGFGGGVNGAGVKIGGDAVDSGLAQIGRHVVPDLAAIGGS